MSKYTKHFKTEETPQNQPIPGSKQVPNSAGGFSFEVNDWTKLDRFLVLGNEGGSYYASEKTMTLKNATVALKCIASDGVRVVNRIVEISEAGRAPKNDPAIFLLALAAGKGDEKTKKAALDALPRVCRIGTHLFQFLEAVQGFRGWGRGLRRAVGEWYLTKNHDALAYQLVKYQQRNGWSHRDALRLAKPRGGNRPELKWAVGKDILEFTAPASEIRLPKVLEGYLKVQKAETDTDVVSILRDYPNLPWEAIPTEKLGSAKVWDALLPNLPLTAMVRNLGRMTANGTLTTGSDATKLVRQALNNEEALRKARVHPIAVLGALYTYKQGHGVKGSLKWNPITKIIDSLDEAFYLSFGNVEPTKKSVLIGLDVSGSMSGGHIANMPGITPRVGSSAMCMVTARTESDCEIMAFSDKFMKLNISPKQRLDDICRKTERLPFSGTDCSLPMTWALDNKMKVDTFIVYTDSETWAGRIQPPQALKKYRDKMGIPAKLVVVGMVANDFTIADPDDAGMLDVVGFDTATPNVIRDFSVQ